MKNVIFLGSTLVFVLVMYLTNYGPRHPAFVEAHEFCGEKVRIINGGSDTVFVVITEGEMVGDQVWEKVEEACLNSRSSDGHYYPFVISNTDNARDVLSELWWELEKDFCKGTRLNEMVWD